MSDRIQAIDFSKFPETKPSFLERIGLERLDDWLHFNPRLRRWKRAFRKHVLRDKGEWPLMTRKVRKERGRYGISRSDVWSLDAYLVQVMERGLRLLATNLHGWPPLTQDGREWTFESWQAHLIELADKLERSLNLVDEAFESPTYKLGDGTVEKAEEDSVRLRREALEDMIEIWGHLWD